MKTALFAALMLCLAACGDDGYDGKTGEAAGDTPPATPSSSGTLTARDAPLSAGEIAPAFEGLPEGKAVVVFYRGHW